MLKIWGRNNSSNVQKVLWCCDEIGLEYEREDVGGQFGRSRDADMLARNPNAVVPTVEDDGFVLWESNVIVRYLAAKHAMGTLYPDTLQGRASRMDWQQTTVLAPITTIFWARVRAPEKFTAAQVDEAIEVAVPRWAILNAQLAKHGWVAGADFTLFENFGDGTFGNPRTLKASSAGSCAILHDRDNDGDLDITGVDEIDDFIFLYENVGR